MSDQATHTTTATVPSGGDPSAEALVLLLDGPLPASDISVLVGWPRRAAGSKLLQLERDGYVRHRREDGDGKPRVVWLLTRSGGEYANNKAQASGRLPAIEPAPDATEPEPVGPPTSPGLGAVDGPWPSLRDASGNPDPERAPTASLRAWLFVLRAARSGLSEGSAATRRVVETHLKDLEQQLGIVWRYGNYELEDGTVITPARLDYLKRAVTPPQRV
jgi:hypothetical protein